MRVDSKIFKLLVALITFSCAAGYASTLSNSKASVLPMAQCLIIDSDSNIDDLRALALLVPLRRVAAVVTTDGMIDAQKGASTIARFLSLMELPAAKRPAVVVGRSRAFQSAAAPIWDWMEPARADMQTVDEALSSLVTAPVPIIKPQSDSEVSQAVRQATKGCSSLGLLVIGPWSSFSSYYHAVRTPWAFVVSQGRSINDPMDPGWDRVNCHIDMTSCQAALRTREKGGIIWVDLPGPGSSFPVDVGLFEQLGQAPGARALATLMSRVQLRQSQHQWDDMPALYLLEPEAFTRVSNHFQPRLDCSAMRDLQIALLNQRAIGPLVEPTATPRIKCK